MVLNLSSLPPAGRPLQEPAGAEQGEDGERGVRVPQAPRAHCCQDQEDVQGRIQECLKTFTNFTC